MMPAAALFAGGVCVGLAAGLVFGLAASSREARAELVEEARYALIKLEDQQLAEGHADIAFGVRCARGAIIRMRRRAVGGVS